MGTRLGTRLGKTLGTRLGTSLAGGSSGGIDPIPPLAPHTRLRADTGVTLNGSAVAQWVSMEGNSRTFVQATAANQPPFTAAYGPLSQPAFTFPGTGAPPKFLDYTGPIADYTFLHLTPSTVCFAYQEPDDNTGYAGAHCLLSTRAANGTTLLGVDTRIGNADSGNGVANTWNATIGLFSSGTYRWKVFRTQVYPTVQGVKTRGSSAYASNFSYVAAPSSADPPTLLRLFATFISSGGRPWQRNAALFEVAIFDYALSDAEVLFVRDYFVARYGVVV